MEKEIYIHSKEITARKEKQTKNRQFYTELKTSQNEDPEKYNTCLV